MYDGIGDRHMKHYWRKHQAGFIMNNVRIEFYLYKLRGEVDRINFFREAQQADSLDLPTYCTSQGG